jgi:hypothetical protein
MDGWSNIMYNLMD